MKKNIIVGILGWIVATLFGYKANCQDTPQANQKETQEIIIRKKGDKDTKVTVEITGDKVLINGKPMAEFNEDGITINNRKMIIKDGNKITMDFNGDMLKGFNDLDNMEGITNIDIQKMDGNDLFGNGSVTRTFLGVSTTKADAGAKVENVSKNSPAEKAGLQNDDIIYKVGDKKIEDASDLSETIRAMKEGDKVKVYFLRDGKKKDVTATLGSTKNSFTINRNFSYSMPNGKTRSFTIPSVPRFPKDMGMDFNFNMENNKGLVFDMRRPKLGIKIQDTDEANGVKVLEVEKTTPAETAGLMKDDVITEIGGKKITNTDEAREELQINKDKTAYDIKAKRNGTEMTFNIKIPKKLKTANL